MSPIGKGSSHVALPSPFQAAVAYFFAGVVWIFATDPLIAHFVPAGFLLVEIGMIKGLLFIALTAMLLYGLLRRQEAINRYPDVASERGTAVEPTTGDWKTPAGYPTAWLGELVEASPECIGVAAMDGRALYLNPAGRTMLGVTEERLGHGIHVKAFYTPAAWDRMQQEVWPAVRREGTWEGDTDLVATDGGVIPAHQVLIAHRDSRGMVTHLSTHARDMRESREREAVLRQTSDILANTAEGVIVVDRDGNIDWVNKAFSTALGYELREVVGWSPAEFGEAGFNLAMFNQICSQVRDGGSWQSELALRRRNGEVFPVRMSVSAFRDREGAVENFICLFSDLTRYKHFESQLSFLANHDPLTGLPNAGRFQEDLGIALGGIGNGQQVCTLLLDLYDFKMINESFGRKAGDAVLLEVAHRLRGLETESNAIARLGGDEFGYFVSGPADEVDPALEAERIRDLFRKPFAVGDTELFLAGSIGVVLAPEDGLDVQTIIRNAEIGVRRAKARGQNVYEFYSEQLQARSTETILIASGLRRAISEGKFDVKYQPILRLDGEVVCGVEALVRWTHPELGVITPDRFIPVAERTGLIQDLGDFVMDRACRDFASILDARPEFRLAINMSPLQIEPEYFAARIRDIARGAGVDPRQIDLEITESLMMQDPEMTLGVFRDLTDTGFAISIDDFGTGFSSLALLKNYPAEVIKIDKSFTQGLPEEPGDAMMTRTIIAMARGLGMQTVAEGIETRSQLAFLVDEGCEYGQGYYFSRPLTFEGIKNLLDG